MRARLRPPDPQPAPEPCVVPGCEVPTGPGRCACTAHFAQLSVQEQVIFYEGWEAALIAPNMQRARAAARLRVQIFLRGVRT